MAEFKINDFTSQKIESENISEIQKYNDMNISEIQNFNDKKISENQFYKTEVETKIVSGDKSKDLNSKTEQIISSLDKAISKKIEKKERIELKDFEKEIVHPESIVETMTATSYVLFILKNLEYIQPENKKLIPSEKETFKQLKEIYKKTISPNEDSRGSVLFLKYRSSRQCSELAKETYTIVNKNFTLFGATLVAIAEGTKKGLEKLAETTPVPDLSNNTEQLDKLVEIGKKIENKIDSLSKDAAEVSLACLANSCYMACKAGMGVGKVGEHAIKFFGEVPAKIVGKDEVTDKIQKSSVIDEYSNKLNEVYESKMQEIDAISERIDSLKNIEKVEKTGDVVEKVTEQGTIIALDIIASSCIASGNIPLGVALSCVSSAAMAGKEIDDKIEARENKEFTKEDAIKGAAIFGVNFTISILSGIIQGKIIQKNNSDYKDYKKLLKNVDKVDNVKTSPIQNKIDGLRRENEVFMKLSKKYPEKKGYSVINEAYLRDKSGTILKDPISGEARRIDFIVDKKGNIIDSIEVTSKTADKTYQIAKETRIREAGGNFIKDYNGNLLEIPNFIRTRIIRRA